MGFKEEYKSNFYFGLDGHYIKSVNESTTKLLKAQTGDVKEYLAANPVTLYTVFGLGVVKLSYDVEKDDFLNWINRIFFDRLTKFIKVDQISRNRMKNTFVGRVRLVAALLRYHSVLNTYLLYVCVGKQCGFSCMAT